MALSLGLYVKRWQRWVAAWLQGIAIIRHTDQRPHKPTPHCYGSPCPGALERHLKGQKNRPFRGIRKGLKGKSVKKPEQHAL
jgi:hypothetical protein